MFARCLILALLGLSACGKPLPPPAAADAEIPLDATHHVLDAVDSNKYMHYAIGTHIDAPPERVWAVLTNADAYESWNSSIASFSGDISADGKVELTPRVHPKRTFKLAVSTFEPTSKMVWEDGSNAFRGVRTFTLTASEGGTDFTMKEAFSGSMMKMIAPKLPDFGDDFDDFAADLKAEAEK